MPLYDYKCLNCDATFEVLIKSPDEDVFCESCGSKNVKRLISSFSFSSSGETGVSTAASSCSTCSSKNCSICR
ncbi:MAG TPA: zinc ribbon domain-containing protein [bacterium]|nr:zinc ribbon domain-containing protein [Dictyoglomota bacterium]HHV81490.1 zinc ribbon domain-containing protein [bacterium]HON72903.1 zinc ribbon domain-containing protein [bacterium]